MPKVCHRSAVSLVGIPLYKLVIHRKFLQTQQQKGSRICTRRTGRIIEKDIAQLNRSKKETDSARPVYFFLRLVLLRFFKNALPTSPKLHFVNVGLCNDIQGLVLVPCL